MTMLKPFRSTQESELRHELGHWHLHGHAFYGYAERDPGYATIWVVNEHENLKWLVAHVRVEACAIISWSFEEQWHTDYTEVWHEQMLSHLTNLLRTEHWAQALKAAFTAHLAEHRFQYQLA